eukprot:Protomagalhaensia_sp_Gyna_25__2539@NODE_2434_length_1087_cov_27_380725_g2016_i0_p1_GENE_NODE_2434_length_1087_cov_27_380725_g2016_i0NODE_2434_length_1087_cov_27_380725_g2016_i0_p1_ORF_typecomplete_len301_score69_49DUF4312/PF14189_6/4_4e02DUF4312/PF14189_6/1_6Prominin/PF05478_11/0_26PNPase/PF03726_14/1_2e02PNPase/PF03726_14/4_8e02PNPase/PF03726_14/5_3e02PNPase/PF03726_14/63_NODE_2434_length_1087_cov_27_380725_g2016_i073975
MRTTICHSIESNTGDVAKAVAASLLFINDTGPEHVEAKIETNQLRDVLMASFGPKRSTKVEGQTDATEGADGTDLTPPKRTADFSQTVALGAIQSVTLRAALSDMEKQVVHEGVEAVLKGKNFAVDGLQPYEVLGIDEALAKEACSERFDQICKAALREHTGANGEELKLDNEALRLKDQMVALKDKLLPRYRSIGDEVIIQTEKAIRESLKDLSNDEQLSTLTKAVAKNIAITELTKMDQTQTAVMDIFRSVQKAITSDLDEVTSSVETPDSMEALEEVADPSERPSEEPSVANNDTCE